MPEAQWLDCLFPSFFFFQTWSLFCARGRWRSARAKRLDTPKAKVVLFFFFPGNFPPFFLFFFSLPRTAMKKLVVAASSSSQRAQPAPRQTKGEPCVKDFFFFLFSFAPSAGASSRNSRGISERKVAHSLSPKVATMPFFSFFSRS